ncbi:unnamed protein product [Withania somnifera]
MELCTPRAFSNLPNYRLVNRAQFQWRPSLLLKKPAKSRFNPGLFYRKGSAIKAETEAYELYVPPMVEEKDDVVVNNGAPIEDSRNVKETDPYASLVYEPPKAEQKDDGTVQSEAPIEDSSNDKETDPYAALVYEPPKVEEIDNGTVQNEAPVEDSSKDKETDAYASLTYEPPKVEEKDDGIVQNEASIEDSSKAKETADAYASETYEPPKVEEKDDGSAQAEASIEDSSLDFDSQLSKLFDKLNIKYDPEDSSSIILFGGVAVTALWLTTSIVGAIDSIPLFPKLLELVGLGYTLWFSARYLLFKSNRDELAAKVEELKQEVLGSRDD